MKLKVAALAALVLTLPALASAAGYTTLTGPDGQRTIAPGYPLAVGQTPGTQTPLGYQQITSLSSAATLTVPNGATVAYVTVSGQAVRWRDDGTAPTATVGVPVAVGAQLVYSGSLSAIQFIQQAASATIDVVYYK